MRQYTYLIFCKNIAIFNIYNYKDDIAIIINLLIQDFIFYFRESEGNSL